MEMCHYDKHYTTDQTKAQDMMKHQNEIVQPDGKVASLLFPSFVNE